MDAFVSWRAAAGAAAVIVVVVVTASLVLAGLRDDTASLPAAPPKVTLSPSGLPVGLLEGKVTRSVGNIAVSNVRLLVRPDGSGTVALGGGSYGGDSKDVEYVRLGPGRVAVRYEGPICANPRALTLGFTVRGRTLTIDATELRGCFASAEMTADLVGATMRIRPLPRVPSSPGGG